MKKITKRIMALMLSLVMILGCVPSFINEANANDIDDWEITPSTYFVEGIRADALEYAVKKGSSMLPGKVFDIRFYEKNGDTYNPLPLDNALLDGGKTYRMTFSLFGDQNLIKPNEKIIVHYLDDKDAILEYTQEMFSGTQGYTCVGVNALGWFDFDVVDKHVIVAEYKGPYYDGDKIPCSYKFKNSSKTFYESSSELFVKAEARNGAPYTLRYIYDGDTDSETFSYADKDKYTIMLELDNTMDDYDSILSSLDYVVMENKILSYSSEMIPPSGCYNSSGYAVTTPNIEQIKKIDIHVTMNDGSDLLAGKTITNSTKFDGLKITYGENSLLSTEDNAVEIVDLLKYDGDSQRYYADYYAVSDDTTLEGARYALVFSIKFKNASQTDVAEFCINDFDSNKTITSVYGRDCPSNDNEVYIVYEFTAYESAKELDLDLYVDGVKSTGTVPKDTMTDKLAIKNGETSVNMSMYKNEGEIGSGSTYINNTTSPEAMNMNDKYFCQVYLKFLVNIPKSVKVNGKTMMSNSDIRASWMIYEGYNFRILDVNELVIEYLVSVTDAKNILTLSNVKKNAKVEDVKLAKLIVTDKLTEIEHEAVYTSDKLNLTIKEGNNTLNNNDTLSKDKDYVIYVNVNDKSALGITDAFNFTNSVSTNQSDYKIQLNNLGTLDWEFEKMLVNNQNNSTSYSIWLKSKTIKRIELTSSGTLQSGDINPTLKYTSADTENYVSEENTTPVSWYKDDTSVSAATPVVKGDTYKKVVTLTSKTGWEFSENLTEDDVYVEDGTVTSLNRIDDNTVEVTIEKVATGIEISIDYDLSTFNKFSDLDSNITSTWTDISYAAYNLNALEESSDYPCQFVAYEILSFDDLEELQSVDKIILNGQNIYDANHKTTNLKADILNKKILYTVDETGCEITVYEKFDYTKNVKITFTATGGKTVKDLFDTLVVSGVDNDPNSNFNVYSVANKADNDYLEDARLPYTTVLEAGKHYILDVWFGGTDDPSVFYSVKCNNDDVNLNDLLSNQYQWNGYKFFEQGSPVENVLKVHYEFEAKAPSSGGGSRKKKTTKTEEPKVEEPKKEEPQTPEEKLKEELLKDDVKKANSNEGEKINPSAKFINGYDDGTFKAERKVNNIELMSMVTQLFDNVEIKETKDLNQGENYWGQEIIDKANALGLVPGNKDDKNYNLTDEVTRGDLAIVVYNLVKDFSNAPSLKDRDNCKDAIGTGYEKEAAKLLELGIFKGYDDGMFHGDYTLTRAEAVVVINRALKSLGFEINMPKISLSFPDLSKDHWAYAEIMYASNK